MSRSLSGSTAPQRMANDSAWTSGASLPERPKTTSRAPSSCAVRATAKKASFDVSTSGTTLLPCFSARLTTAVKMACSSGVKLGLLPVATSSRSTFTVGTTTSTSSRSASRSARSRWRRFFGSRTGTTLHPGLTPSIPASSSGV